ncbi:MAG: protein-L-isoaspartate O-methyltransferase [Candidatus Nealsonbacteria bacterium]
MLVDSLIKNEWLKTPEIISAFRKIKRKDFMTEETKGFSEVDEAMLIGKGQTISQPLVVAFMLEKLNPKPKQKILDIGSGSGWTSALLAYIVGLGGKVIAIEIIPELKEFGQKNASKYNFVKKGIAEFICADGSKGYKKEAPFDNILVSASLSSKIPFSWKKQLKIKGKIVAPIKDSIWVFEKESENKFKKTEYPGFVFVSFVSK